MVPDRPIVCVSAATAPSNVDARVPVVAHGRCGGGWHPRGEQIRGA